MLPPRLISRDVAGAGERSRLPALDYVKAAAIVAVALTHAVPFFDGGVTDTGMLAFALTGFHVPAFLLVSGFLSRAEAPVGWRHVAERLRRILPPYFVATAVVWMLGWVRFPTVRKFVFKIVTGASLGHFYFIPILAFCFLLLPILSRLTGAQLLVTGVALGGLTVAMWMEPAWRLTEIWFWQVRDPVLQFHVGYFLLGVLAARYRRALVDAFARHATAIGLAAGIGIIGFACVAAAQSPWAAHPLVRIAYTLAVIGLIVALTPHRPAPAAVRFLSNATLTIYLYHWLVYPPLTPLVTPMSLGLRMLVLAGAGLSFGTLVVVVGRRLLGKRSHLLLGS